MLARTSRLSPVSLVAIAATTLLVFVASRAPAQDAPAPPKHPLVFAPEPTAGFTEDLDLEATAFTTRPHEDVYKRTLAARIERKIVRLVGPRASEHVVAELTSAASFKTVGATEKTAATTKVELDLTRTPRGVRLDAPAAERERIVLRTDPLFLAFLARDPDGLAHALAPRDAIALGGSWRVPPRALLAILGAADAAIVGEDSTAQAKLESYVVKDGKPEAKVSFTATIVYRPDPEAEDRETLEVTGTLEGPTDGSTPPRREEVSLDVKHSDEAWKEVATYVLVRRAGDAPPREPSTGPR